MTPSQPATLAVFGDSIAAGLGVRGQEFPAVVGRELGMDVRNLSDAAFQVSDAFDRLAAASGADVVVIAHGVTEAILRPPARALRLVPPRWRRAGWLDPRPYFSTRRVRGVGQRLESGLRWRIKVALMRVFGGERWCEPEAYEALLERLALTLEARVLILSNFGVDDRFFPGSDASMARYATIGHAVALRTGATFVDVSACCARWDDFLADHLHPNRAGHRRIADAIIEALNEPSTESPGAAGDD